MLKLLTKILPDNDKKRLWVAIVFTLCATGLLTYLGVYVFEDYGVALFIFTPLFIGAAPALIYGLKKNITKKFACWIGFLTLVIFIAALLFFGIEGMICIVMAAPIVILFTWIGSLVGHSLITELPRNAPTSMLILFGIIPATAFLEQGKVPELTSVVTSIEIDATPEDVWNHVVQFPQLDEPTEFIFKTGIAYPINAKIEGTGVSAIRHCNFTTGSFVEPITVWNEPYLLKFAVLEQPAPMKELSFWDINAPHLHDYFVSKEGQFKLTALPNGNTLLEGTTWYYHHIRPAYYWQIWSNYIIHKIHERVLTHIKKNAEA